MGRTPNRASYGDGCMLADVMAERESKRHAQKGARVGQVQNM